MEDISRLGWGSLHEVMNSGRIMRLGSHYDLRGLMIRWDQRAFSQANMWGSSKKTDIGEKALPMGRNTCLPGSLDWKEEKHTCPASVMQAAACCFSSSSRQMTCSGVASLVRVGIFFPLWRWSETRKRGNYLVIMFWKNNFNGVYEYCKNIITSEYFNSEQKSQEPKAVPKAPCLTTGRGLKLVHGIETLQSA